MKNTSLSILFGFFALVGTDGVVKNVIVADQAFVDAHPPQNGGWVETALDGSKGKRYARRGASYIDNLKAFVDPKPFPSWIFNSVTADWEPPKPKKNDGKKYTWDEATKDWKELKF